MRDHFQGKSALSHLAEVRSTGVATSLEIHGAETPGPLFAFLDAARQTSVILLIVFLISDFYSFSYEQTRAGLLTFFAVFIFWSGARSTLLAYNRINRLHTIALEEKEEIEQNRPQEREELIALYGLKGFSGELLEKVVDVLMADQDRLLKVMLQEEMGFKLEESAHPLIQGLFAALGSVLPWIFVMVDAFGCPMQYLIGAVVVFLAGLGALLAKFERNLVLPAFVWNLSIGVVCCVILRMCLKIFAT